MKRFFLLLLANSTMVNAATFNVGPTRTYTTPNALYSANVVADGDIIEIDFANYSGTACLANWSKNNLVIKGVGGKPHMIANSQNIQGKGIWITSGNNITVENIEFSGATVADKNGAGIRAEGPDVTIRNCYFHNNENGILTNNPYSGNVLIESSEFSYNGYGDGQSHNLYIGHVNKLIFQYNYVHHANIGHNLKSRANENIILYNRIADEDTGNSSRLIDLPNGGFSIIMGNILMQGNNAVNNNMVGYGLEGLTNSLSELYFINNTMVNKKTGSNRFLHIQSGTNVVQVINNVFAGIGTLIDGTATLTTKNLIETNIAALHFVNESNYNYNLLSTSPAINIGTALTSVKGYSLVPSKTYVHPMDFENRVLVSTMDVGAYEYNILLGSEDFDNDNFNIYPNPTASFIILENYNLIDRIQIIDISGKIIKEFKPTSSTINLEYLQKGIYILKMFKEDKVSNHKIVKI